MNCHKFVKKKVSILIKRSKVASLIDICIETTLTLMNMSRSSSGFIPAIFSLLESSKSISVAKFNSSVKEMSKQLEESHTTLPYLDPTP